MKKLLFSFIASICITISSFAQLPDTLTCDVPDRDTTELENLPWFGNNQYLENFLDSIGYPNNTASRIINLDQVRFHVPIKFWIYRNSAGVGGPTMNQIQDYITNLNNFFNFLNHSWIGFYVKCEIGFIDDDDHLVINNDLEAWNLIQNHKEKGCINIHVTNVLNDANGVLYRARFFGVDGIFLSQQTYTRPDLAGTIAHEVGHYFELDHTHQYSSRGKCRKEPIDRNRTWPFISFCPFGGGGPTSERICEATGDILSDTPADHDLSSNFSCNYSLTGNTDPWGDHYETPPSGSLSPDPINLMNYNGQRGCRAGFSRLQIAVMLHSIVRGKSKSNKDGWEAVRTIYDEYEMDNFPTSPSTITISEIQERNFHQQYNEASNGTVTWTNCDVDWIRFTAPCSGLFDIETFFSAGTIKPDTRLTLFNNTGTTQLAQNDDKSATDKFSKISFNFTGGTTYLIRVENLNPQIVYYNHSYYNISVGGARISGVNEFCSSSTFTLDAPAGTTTTWSISPSPNNIVNTTINGNAITLTQKPIGSNPRISNSGTITITASYNSPCLGNGTTTKTVFVGTKTPSYGIYAPDGNCPGNSFEAIATSNNSGSVTYDWYINGTLNSYHGYKIRSSFSSPTGTYIGVQVRKTGCGISQEYYQFWPCEGQFRVSPNPASSTLQIESESSFEKIRLLDKTGNVKGEWVVPKSTKITVINIGNFTPDIYSIQIFDGTQWSGKIISKH